MNLVLLSYSKNFVANVNPSRYFYLQFIILSGKSQPPIYSDPPFLFIWHYFNQKIFHYKIKHKFYQVPQFTLILYLYRNFGFTVKINGSKMPFVFSQSEFVKM